MKLEIIGAGWGRTGTLSLYEALNLLGWRTHHMEELKNGRADKKHWILLGRGDPRGDLSAALAGYTAACDYPSCLYYKELLRMNPTAKVILTVRDADKWYESTSQTNWAIPGVIAKTWILGYFMAGFLRDGNDMILRRAIGGHQYIDNREHCIAAYKRHIEEVKRFVPPAQLLVFEVKEGWGPLCEFLGKPVPSVPFPNVNEADKFKRIFRSILLADRMLTAGLVFGVSVVGYYLLGK